MEQKPTNRSATMVIAFLGTFAIAALVAATIVLLVNPSVNEATMLALFVSPMSGAIGGLGAMLANAHSQSATQQVEVTNKPSDPIPTKPSEPDAPTVDGGTSNASLDQIAPEAQKGFQGVQPGDAEEPPQGP